MLSCTGAYAKAEAKSPLAGSGVGASACEDTWIGARSGGDGVSLPRIRQSVAAASQDRASAGLAPELRPQAGFVAGTAAMAMTGAGRVGSGSAAGRHVSNHGSNGRSGAAFVGAGQVSTTEQPNQKTPISRVIPGGVGPHPAREPDPV
jgi:hypothetical protein